MLVLASASPRRQEILRNAGIAFVAQPSDVPEVPVAGELPRAYAERLAREKALAVLRHRPADLVLGADTIVVIDSLILGKPLDPADAVRMLQLLSGREHQVITGVCLARLPQTLRTGNRNLPTEPQPDPGFEDVRSEKTLVTMVKLTDAEIQRYVGTGEPLDKAGAYAIQGIASGWIPRIEGDYFNVVGLPMAMVYRMLREHGCFETGT